MTIRLHANGAPSSSLPGGSHCGCWGRGGRRQGGRHRELFRRLQAQLQERQRAAEQAEEKKGGGGQRGRREASQVGVAGQHGQVSLPLLCGRQPAQLRHEDLHSAPGSVWLSRNTKFALSVGVLIFKRGNNEWKSEAWKNKVKGAEMYTFTQP